MRLSKSRIMSSLQCLKRVHLEVNAPELARYSKATQAAFDIGHQVGDAAVRLFAGNEGVYIDYGGGSLGPALARTRELMTSMIRVPICEATIQHDDVLVREDVLLPVTEGDQASWRVVEVKASTRLKPEHANDCAVQAWVHREAGYPLAGMALAHIDNTFVYHGEGDYSGLFLEHDLSAEVSDLLPSVPIWVEEAREAAAGALPDVPPGQQCTAPYPCPFLHVCWPVAGEDGVEFPITGLGGSRKVLGQWLAKGYRDIRDVPAAEISSETQQRIHRVTRSGAPELLPGARAFTEELPFPRFYLDFETIGPAVPFWAGTRPYQNLPIQWSCHVERAPGVLEHAEFLDLSGKPPMRGLAEALIETLESAGPVLMYTGFERGVIRNLAAMYGEMAAPLEGILDRLVDLHPVTRANYYHPEMLGSWSIKSVLPTIAPDMDYASLEGVHEGTEASAAFLEAISASTSRERREALRAELLDYCRHDTLAMVRLVSFFAGS